MKTRLTAAILGMFLAVSVGFADNIKKRERRQQERINDGVKDGELTKKEALTRISILTLVRRQYTPTLPEYHVFPR